MAERGSVDPGCSYRDDIKTVRRVVAAIELQASTSGWTSRLSRELAAASMTALEQSSDLLAFVSPAYLRAGSPPPGSDRGSGGG
jgi:hypothetical protein